jgi:hypothetical protein
LNNSRIELSLLDKNGVLVVPALDLPIDVLRETQPLSVIGITARDWYEPDASAAWGMRDSMTSLEMTFGASFAINVPDLTLSANAVYTVKIVPKFVTGIYVYNLYARFIPLTGSGI